MRPWSLPGTNRLRFALHGGQRLRIAQGSATNNDPAYFFILIPEDGIRIPAPFNRNTWW
ncbi:hypothetical protein [Thiolapillus sp.]|uniref:hypothetical protein n=1 Tax=Thiolapillus sp. TaxID=2017437 RepID=UPI003AF80A4D